MQKVVSIKFEFPAIDTTSVRSHMHELLTGLDIKVIDVWDSEDDRPQVTEKESIRLSGIQESSESYKYTTRN